MFKICVLLITISFVAAFSTVDLFAQKSGERYVSLKRNARKNGYRTVTDNGVVYFEAENVEDGGTQLQGEKKLEYRCQLNELPILKKLLFSNGRSNREKVECLVLITPRIIISE
jgi:hypothetical protein